MVCAGVKCRETARGCTATTCRLDLCWSHFETEVCEYPQSSLRCHNHSLGVALLLHECAQAPSRSSAVTSLRVHAVSARPAAHPWLLYSRRIHPETTKAKQNLNKYYQVVERLSTTIIWYAALSSPNTTASLPVCRPIAARRCAPPLVESEFAPTHPPITI